MFPLTIFTPIYNRAHLIERTYQSLCQQTCKEFEWLLINDGSTDSSDEVILNIIKNHNNSFPINYIKKENEGLMRTINRATEIANGELFCRLDSDDYALPTLAENIIKHYPLIKDNEKLCSIVFLSQTETGKINGFHPFNTIVQCSFGEYRDKYAGIGDRSEVVKTSVYRKFKFPEFPNEKFISEGVVWNRMASIYNAIYIPVPIYVKTSPADSITSNIFHTLKRNCQGSVLLYREIMLNKRFSFRCRAINSIKYYRYAIYAKANFFKGIPIGLILFGLPLGLLVIIHDKIKYHRK